MKTKKALCFSLIAVMLCIMSCMNIYASEKEERHMILTDPVVKQGFWSGDGWSEDDDPTKVTFTPSVVQVEDDCMARCGTVEEVVWNASLNRIPDGAFSECYSLKKITLSPNVTEIGYGAFYDTRLKEVILPSNLRSIGDYAFALCPRLKIYIPESVTDIGNNVFQGDDGTDTHVTVYGKAGSFADYFCKINGYAFVPVGQAEKPADDRPYIVNSKGTVINHRIDFTIELMEEVEGVDGYHFQFLDDSMQKVIKNKNVKASTGGKYKFSSCPETMYVRARAWTQENGKKVYSGWSNMEHLYCYVGGETAVIKSAEGRKNQVVLNFVPLQFSDGFDCKLIGRSPGAPDYAMKNQRSNQIVFKNVKPGIYAAKGRAYRIVNGKKNYGNKSNIVKVVVE